MKKNYDEDGFFVLYPRKHNGGKHPPTIMPREDAGTYGDVKLKMIESGKLSDMGTAKNMARARASAVPQYDIPYAPKTWQRKAWEYIGDDIDWEEKTPFRKIKRAPKKVRHIKCIAVALKVRMYSRKRARGKPVIDQIASNNSGYGIYVVATTPAEFQDLLDRMYVMMHDNLDKYLDKALKNHYGGVDYVSKCLIIYDDKSIDSVTGDPRNMHRILGLDWNSKKGLEYDEG